MDINRNQSTNNNEHLVENDSIKEPQPNSKFPSSFTNTDDIKTTIIQDRKVSTNDNSIAIKIDNAHTFDLKGFDKMTNDIVNQVEEKHGKGFSSKLKLLFKDIIMFLKHVECQLAIGGVAFAGLLVAVAVTAVAIAFMGPCGLLVFVNAAICIVPFMICCGMSIVKELENWNDLTEEEKNDKLKNTYDKPKKDKKVLIDTMQSIKNNVFNGVTPDNLKIQVVNEKSDEHSMDLKIQFQNNTYE